MLLKEKEKEKQATQLNLFNEHLPLKPYCTDEKSAGLVIRSKAFATIKKYIQHNQPCQHRWLVYDCDYWGALEHIGQNHLPVPNLIATNPKNGHSHLFYGLTTPVVTSEKGRKKPLSLLAKIDFVLCEKLMADQGYIGLISQNPLKNTVWDVHEVNPHSWDLGDFLEFLDLPEKLPKLSKLVGFGRNVTIFETARRWAYKEVLAYRLASNQAKFFECVLAQCQSINQTFPAPLALSEVKATAKSIARWTWKNYVGRVSDGLFSQIQAKRGKAGGLKSGRGRTSTDQEKRLKARSMALDGATQASIAQVVGVSQGTISNWLKSRE